MVTMEMFIQANVLVCLGKHSGLMLLCMRTNSLFCGYVYVCYFMQACNHIAALLFFIEYHVDDEDLPTEIPKTSKPMAWNQPPKKTVAPECSSSMRFVKPSHDNLSVQQISRSTFDPRAVEHQGDVDKERVCHLIACVRDSMPCLGLQHFWCDGPNTETNLAMSHCGVMYSFHMVP